MEERNDVIISIISHGCNLAKVVESNLPNLANNHPHILSQKCDEIIGVFTMAKYHLNSLHPPPLDPDHHHQQEVVTTAGISREMAAAVFGYAQQPRQERGKEVVGDVVAPPEGSMKTVDSGGGRSQESRPCPPETGGSSSSAQLRNPRKSSRKHNQADNRIVRMAAPQVGNIEMPPEDGFTWRKYGQKEILGAKFPRSYYRCTHQKLYGCPAKKQVQRLDDNPFTFEILYRGDHTCHMSSTAPSVPPPQPSSHHDIILSHQLLASSIPTSPNQWLSMDFSGRPPSGDQGASSTPFDPQLLRVSSSSTAGGPSTVGSHQPSPRDVVDFLHHQPVLDLADVMFNTGSSSSNSMEVIFPPFDHKWEAKDNKDINP